MKKKNPEEVLGWILEIILETITTESILEESLRRISGGERMKDYWRISREFLR